MGITPDVYGSYVSTNKAGKKVLIVECLDAVYGAMVAGLLYYKKFIKSLTKHGYKLNPFDGCVALSGMERPRAANVQGTSTFGTFVCVIEST